MSQNELKNKIFTVENKKKENKTLRITKFNIEWPSIQKPNSLPITEYILQTDKKITQGCCKGDKLKLSRIDDSWGVEVKEAYKKRFFRIDRPLKLIIHKIKIAFIGNKAHRCQNIIKDGLYIRWA